MNVDVAIIGSGPGGYVAALRAKQLGLNVLCIEKEPSLGGTCLNVGCIPSKALLQSTEYYEKVLKEGKQHGIDCRDLSANLLQMMKRKAEIVKGLTEGIAGLFKRHGVAHLAGQARFISDHQLEVLRGSDRTLVDAKNVILATGSEPISLPFLPFDEKIVLSSTGALSLAEVPKKMIVIGAGAIGLELASVYRRLGAEIIVVEMLDRIAPAMDLGVSKQFQRILEKQGFLFHLSTKVTGAKIGKKDISLSLVKDNQTSELKADLVLVAIGRRPFTQGLGLHEAGIQTNPAGFVQVDSSFRTSRPHVFAIGDLIEGPMLAHKASEEGIAVAEIIAGKAHHLNYLAIPNVIYTWPEVASVGFTEEEARKSGLEIKIGSYPFKGNPRARCSGEEDGFVKVIGEAKSGRLIGMHILGAHASEMIGEGMIAIEKKATLEDLARAPHAHPTLSEAIREAALSALGRVLHM